MNRLAVLVAGAKQIRAARHFLNDYLCSVAPTAVARLPQLADTLPSPWSAGRVYPSALASAVYLKN